MLIALKVAWPLTGVRSFVVVRWATGAVLTGVGAVLNTARVAPGSSVAVFGVGGVGLNVLQGAVLAGAGPIIAVDLSPAKLEFARGFGATHTVDASAGDPALDEARE